MPRLNRNKAFGKNKALSVQMSTETADCQVKTGREFTDIAYRQIARRLSLV
jgi:hypothetical protein